MRRAVCILNFAFCITALACGPRRLALPTDAGTPFPDFAAVHKQVSSACTGVRTLTAQLSLRGRVGGQRLSGRVIAGFEQPASMRLEGLAPIGQPVFHLAAQGGTGTLWLPRESRVLRGQPAEAILDALIGVNLAPADLQSILTGCVVPNPMPTGGRQHANGWASIDLAGGATIYLQPAAGGMWTLRAARRAGWQIEYPAWSGGFPQTVRLQATQPALMVDLTVGLSQIETNKDLEDAAFSVNVPRDAEAITLDELRENGPLGAR